MTGSDLLERGRLHTRHRGISEICPGCDSNCSSAAMIDLAYTFRTCSCSVVEYAHLVEQLWHLACLQDRRPDVDRAADSLLYALERTNKGYGAQVAQRAATLRAALDERRQAPEKSV